MCESIFKDLIFPFIVVIVVFALLILMLHPKFQSEYQADVFIIRVYDTHSVLLGAKTYFDCVVCADSETETVTLSENTIEISCEDNEPYIIVKKNPFFANYTLYVSLHDYLELMEVE